MLFRSAVVLQVVTLRRQFYLRISPLSSASALMYLCSSVLLFTALAAAKPRYGVRICMSAGIARFGRNAENIRT